MQRKIAFFAIIFLARFAVAQQPAAPGPPAAHHGHATEPAQSPDKIWSDQIDPAVMKVKGSATGEALIEAAIKENVHQSAMDVLAHSEVLRHAKEQGKLTVIEAEYQLDTGEVVRLDKATQ